MALQDAQGKPSLGKAHSGPPLGEGKPTPPVGGVVASPQANWPTYPSSGLTPERLSAIFREADAGDISRQIELYEEMEEKDAHLGAVLQTRKLAVAGLQWEVTPSAAGDDAAASAGLVKDALAAAAGFDEAILTLVDAVGKGFAAVELIWRADTGCVALSELKPVSQRSFFFLAPDGLPSGEPRLLTEANPVRGEALTPMKFAIHTNMSRTAYPQRAGVLRPCAWMYLFKNYTLKDWLIFNERYAMPMRVGKFGPSASEADRRVLRNAVFNLGTDAAAVISEGTVIELLESPGKGSSADLYQRLAEYCDRSISKAVLGQTLTTEQTGGTYATALVHEGVREDITVADAHSLERTISSQIIRPLVEFNLGPGAPLPRFRFLMAEEEDLKTLAQTYSTLSAMGVSIPDAHIRERFGIPAGQGGN